MVTRDDLLQVLATINDPEMPISIVDLGIVAAVRVEPGNRVEVDLLPTFVGCPALHLIEDQIRSRIQAVQGTGEVVVHICYDPPWSVDRISAAGRDSLRRFGVTVPDGEATAPTCPFCGSAEVQLESSFGPTRCRMIYYCASCRNPFEHLKRVAQPRLQGIATERLQRG